ncbi:coiled-coil domain-containing protein 157 [Hoplias malabaricus]|uniref:coiled-coil domain-containing protein 157 n=1 Tax=Hoplias malabaricus TaxID=27720 RepID=UPI00346311DB
MTHLLGRQDCVESLRRDVIDLQEAVLDVCSRTGPVRVSSWKFPDKLSCNLDLVQLLQEYDYTEGDTEFNQHSHVVLLELVIDRLMLLLQSFNVYTERLIEGRRAASSGRTGLSMSIGPVVKRYWNNLLQLSSIKKPGKLTNVGSQRTPPSSASQNVSPAEINTSTPSASKPPSSSPPTTAPPSGHNDRRSVGAQTMDSALVPCEACARVQSSLKDTAEACVSLCRTLGLNSFLQHLLVAVEDSAQLGRLTATDVAQWACEQRRDMSRIGKHAAEVNETVDTLRENLRKAEEKREELKAQLRRERERAEKERKERQRKEVELKTRGDEEQRRLRDEQEELKIGLRASELRVSELTGELELHRETQQSLQCERESLVEEVHALHLKEERWREKEKRWREEEEQRRRETETELRNTHTLLEKESAKYRSAQRQHEAMQVKQGALLERVSVLVQQCEDLQTRLEECEDERTELTHTLTHTTQERDTLQQQLTQKMCEWQWECEEKEKQSERVCELEESLLRLKQEFEQAAQREKILVAFPELHPSQTAPLSTGDVVCDMEQQLKANSVRIRVLEQENASLQKSLDKLRDAGQGRAEPVVCPDSGGPERVKSEGAVVRTHSSSLHSSSNSTSPSVLHQQSLSLSPNTGHGVRRIQQNTRSAGPRSRRK